MPAVIVATVLFAALFIWFTGESLPAVVASSFDASGAARGRMSREAYLVAMAGIAIGMPLLFALGGRWIAKLPNGVINIPRKDYWLAPERRAESLRAMASHLQVFGVLMAIFLCYVHWLVVEANTVGQRRLDNTMLFIGVGAFVLLTIVWMVALHRRFGSGPSR